MLLARCSFPDHYKQKKRQQKGRWKAIQLVLKDTEWPNQLNTNRKGNWKPDYLERKLYIIYIQWGCFLHSMDASKLFLYLHCLRYPALIISLYKLLPFYSGAPRARGRILLANKIYPSKKIWWSSDRTPTAHRPYARTTGNQCSISHFLTSLRPQVQPDIVHSCWSIDNCQNRVSADQYHLAVWRAQVSTHWGPLFFEVIRWQVTSFQTIAAQVHFFKWIGNKLCLFAALLKFRFPTDLGHKNSASFKSQGRQLILTFLTMVTLYVQVLCSDCSRWIQVNSCG